MPSLAALYWIIAAPEHTPNEKGKEGSKIQ